jgi:hypothetical protein
MSNRDPYSDFPHEDLFSQQSLTKLFTSQVCRRASPPLDSDFLELLGASCGGRRGLFASREFQQTDQFFDLGFIQLMQRLVYLVPNGGVEFVQEIEPRLGDETKNLSAVIGRAFPAHELLPFQPIQQAGYTRCLFDHLLSDVQCRKPPRPAPRCRFPLLSRPRNL